MSEDDDQIVTVKLPLWKVKIVEKIVEERQAYNVITAKLVNWWIWAVVGGTISLVVLWDTLKFKIGGN